MNIYYSAKLGKMKILILITEYGQQRRIINNKSDTQCVRMEICSGTSWKKKIKTMSLSSHCSSQHCDSDLLFKIIHINYSHARKILSNLARVGCWGKHGQYKS